jgi:hypothetical protein
MNNNGKVINKICDSILDYLLDVQDFTPGEYYGSFWSEKAYHGPLLDWHGGGAHHHRGCGSAALTLWLTGKATSDKKLMHRAEQAFDWLACRQHERGGWFEIQNNEKPSNWEGTGLDELSTISTGFAVHGLAEALLAGLPPKKSYMDCLQKAGHWFLSIEFPPGSGIFPHHERSPYDTLNASMHAADALILIHRALNDIYGKPVNIFLQGARRAVEHTLPLQWDNGCMPYRDYGFTTINYTSLVLWCLLNTLENLPEYASIPTSWMDNQKCYQAIIRGCEYLRNCINDDGSLKWAEYETSTARNNMWTYFITLNVLLRVDGKANIPAIEKLMKFIVTQIGNKGLPRMRDEGEEITKCAFMQADILMFTLPFSKYNPEKNYKFIMDLQKLKV